MSDAFPDLSDQATFEPPGGRPPGYAPGQAPPAHGAVNPANPYQQAPGVAPAPGMTFPWKAVGVLVALAGVGGLGWWLVKDDTPAEPTEGPFVANPPEDDDDDEPQEDDDDGD